MKTSRFKKEYRKNASSLHMVIGNILRTSPLFCHWNSFQEYPVNKIHPNSNGRWHYDWVIPSLKIVIEAHGKQHYEVCAFDGDNDKAVENFHAQKRRDKLKKEAAELAGWKYIEISYKEQKLLTPDYLLDKFNSVPDSPLTVVKKEKKQTNHQNKKRKEYLKSDSHQLELEKARKYRKAQYQIQKEKKKEWILKQS